MQCQSENHSLLRGQNDHNLYSFSGQNKSKTIPCEAASTDIASITQHPPPPDGFWIPIRDGKNTLDKYREDCKEGKSIY